LIDLEKRKIFTMTAERNSTVLLDLAPYPDPMSPYMHQTPLTETTEALSNMKRFYTPTSSTVTSDKPSLSFPSPILNASNCATSPTSGFDAHIYFSTESILERQYAKRLHSAVRYAFPSLRVYEPNNGPAGPHPIATFEVALFDQEEFAMFVPWLCIWHGPLSVLIHPNTLDKSDNGETAVGDHTVRAMWLGEKVNLGLDALRRHPSGNGGGVKLKVGF
jgi:aromatic ring-cleaving dioxygenase